MVLQTRLALEFKLTKNEKRYLYLKAGLGELCAGHVNAMELPSCFLKAKESTIVENLGLDDPTGSVKMERSFMKMNVKVT